MRKPEALIRPESELRGLFPEGRIPIKSTKMIEHEGEKWYEADLERFTDQQIADTLIAIQKKFDRELSENQLFREGFIIRVSHTEGYTV